MNRTDNLVECESSFKGNKFKFCCVVADNIHPSHHTFQDEIPTMNAMWNILPGSYVLDVGASFGSYSLTALALGAEKVYAWSPQSYNGITEKSVLEASAELNGWKDKIIVNSNGVYNKSGWLDCYRQIFYDTKPDNFVKSNITSADDDLLKVDKLDDWYHKVFLPVEKEKIKNKRIWMKLDVEAAELEVVEGGQDLIRELNPIIMNENHTCLKPGIDEEFKQLMKSMFGYREIKKMNFYDRSHSVFIKE